MLPLRKSLTRADDVVEIAVVLMLLAVAAVSALSVIG